VKIALLSIEKKLKIEKRENSRAQKKDAAPSGPLASAEPRERKKSEKFCRPADIEDWLYVPWQHRGCPAAALPTVGPTQCYPLWAQRRY
jgi:hypothetical protein